MREYAGRSVSGRRSERPEHPWSDAQRDPYAFVHPCLAHPTRPVLCMTPNALDSASP